MPETNQPPSNQQDRHSHIKIWQQNVNGSQKAHEDLLHDVSPDNYHILVYPYDTPDLGEQVFPPFDQAKATVYRYRQQQSVNLGSW